MDRFMKWTGEKVKSLRLKLGWSRAELGRRLGLNVSQVFELEEGKLPLVQETIDSLYQLSSHLNDYSRSLKVKGLSLQHLKKESKTQASSMEVEEFANESKLK